MTKTIYYADKVIIFTSDYQTSEGKTLFVPKGKKVSVHRMLKSLEDTRTLTVHSFEIKEVFDSFCRNFTHVNAAGGAVIANNGEILMIHRRGFWDLPKGHCEQNEELEQCALREVAEECGIDPDLIEMDGEIARTLHFYWLSGKERWEMKLTVWYRMLYSGDLRHVTPQTQEGITTIEWMTLREAKSSTAESYKTIQEVIGKI